MAKGKTRRLPNGLTQKENALKNKVLEQIHAGKPINQTEAAMQVYDTNDRKAAGKIASEVLAKQDIKEEIEQALTTSGLTPSFVTQEIKKIAAAEAIKITGDVKLRSLMEIAKLLGMYPGKKSMNLNVNLKGKVSNMGFEELKNMHDKMSARVGELVEDSK